MLNSLLLLESMIIYEVLLDFELKKVILLGDQATAQSSELPPSQPFIWLKEYEF